MSHPARCLLLFYSALPLAACAQALDSLLPTLPTFRDSVAPRLGDFELQILYRPLVGPDSGQSLAWGLAPERYFYPASAVKLPVAALALEAIADLDVDGLTSASPMEIASAEPPQTPSLERLGAPGEAATLAGHVRDIGIVSSNEAYNRLFEWLGPRYINEELHRRGLDTRIVHRLGDARFGPPENQRLNPVAFRHAATGDTVYYRGAASAKTPYAVTLAGERKGVGRYDDATGEVVPGPFDFSTKNYLGLADLATVLQAVVAPQTVDSATRFRMRATDRELLLDALNTRPADSDNPLHHGEEDGYVNFLYYGGEGSWEADGPVIYNKVGDAYGYLTDAAVFADPETQQPLFVLAATIHVNANGVYNDGVYEYETIGLPFLRELGRAVWDAYPR